MTPLAAALLLSLVHLSAGLPDAIHRLPRVRLLSFASGTVIGFVFLDLVPELAASHQLARSAAEGTHSVLERNVFFVALMGVTFFYGLERLALGARRPARAHADGTAGGALYWIHIAAFALHDALVGYLLVHRIGAGRRHSFLIALALAFYFLVNDVGLRAHHKRHYAGVGRWILVAAPLLGLAAGHGATPTPMAVAVLFAFVAGGILVNVLKEELPQERQARFWPFLVGVLVYALLAGIG